MNNETAIYFGQKGYTIYKENLEIKEQELIRKELTVSPYVPKNSLQKPSSFQIYRESPKKMYLPKYYGYREYGEPDEIRLTGGDDIAVAFKGELRDFQNPIVNTYLENAKKKRRWSIRNSHGCRQDGYGIKNHSKIKKKNINYRS